MTTIDNRLAAAVADLLNRQELVYTPRREATTTPLPSGGGAPTIVVAAYNASPMSKQKADLICTGLNDEGTFAQALEELSTTVGVGASVLSGRMLVTEGDYYFSKTVTVGIPIRIEGMGVGSTRLHMAAGANVSMFTVVHTAGAGSGPVSMSDMELDGSYSNNPAGVGNGIHVGPNGGVPLNFNNLRIHHFRGSGIWFNRCADQVTVTNCQIYNNLLDGIYAAIEGWFMFTNNFIYSNSRYGIWADGSKIQMANSILYNNSQGGLFGSSDGATITGNSFIQNQGYAVYITGTVGGAITGNSFYGNLNGLGILGPSTATGNTFDANFGTAVTLTGLRGGTFSGNALRNNRLTGILVSGDNWNANGNRLENNAWTPANTNDQINVSGSNNLVVGNLIRQESGLDPRYGINVTGSCNRIAGNDFGDPASYGTDAYGDSGANNQRDWPSDGAYGDNFTECEPGEGEEPVDLIAPEQPLGLTANGGLGEVVLDWDDNVDADLESYNIYQATSVNGPWTLVGEATTSTFTVTGLLGNTAYWFRVTAEDISGNQSEPSDTATATTDTPAVDTTPPAAPTGLSATGGSKQVELNWTDNAEPDLATYRVKRALVTGGPYTTVATVTASQYIDTGLADGTAYFYVVTAVDDSGNESTASTEATTETADAADTTPPAVPTGLIATGGLGQVVLNWDDNTESDLALYRIYMATASGGPFNQIGTRIGSAMTVTGLAAATQYWFKVAAEDTTGNISAQSASQTATTDTPVVDTTPPAAPTGLTATGGSGQVTLNWADNAESDLASYRVKRATVTGGPYTVISNVTTSNYVDLGLAASTQYFYVVTAVDTSGNESANSSQVSATTTGTVVTPGTFPPPTPPQPVANPAYPTTPDITLNPGDSINGALSAGHRIIKLNPGFYGSQQIAPRTGSTIYCQTGVATFDGGAIYNRPFITGGTAASNVTIRGFEVKRYYSEISGSAGRGAIRTPSGSTGWKFIQMHVWHFNNTAFDFGGSDHQVINSVIHDGARYAFHGGARITMKGCEIYRMCVNDGTQLVPVAPDTNRGVSKFSAGVGGFVYEDNYQHDIPARGFWMDGTRGGATIRRIKSVNVDRGSIMIEVSYGPFTIEDIDVVNGARGISQQDWPSFAAIEIGLSPHAHIKRFRARNVGVGIGLINNDTHPAYQHGIPGAGVTAAQARPNLGLSDTTIHDIDIQASRHAIGYAGNADDVYSDIPDTTITITGKQLYLAHSTPQYGSGFNPAFRVQGAVPISLSTWNATNYPDITK